MNELKFHNNEEREDDIMSPEVEDLILEQGMEDYYEDKYGENGSNGLFVQDQEVLAKEAWKILKGGYDEYKF